MATVTFLGFGAVGQLIYWNYFDGVVCGPYGASHKTLQAWEAAHKLLKERVQCGWTWFFFSVITFTGGKDPGWEVHRKSPSAVAIGRGIEFPYFVTCMQCAVQVILFVSYLLFVSACTHYVGMGIGRRNVCMMWRYIFCAFFFKKKNWSQKVCCSVCCFLRPFSLLYITRQVLFKWCLDWTSPK